MTWEELSKRQDELHKKHKECLEGWSKVFEQQRTIIENNTKIMQGYIGLMNTTLETTKLIAKNSESVRESQKKCFNDLETRLKKGIERIENDEKKGGE